jgi:hypothetical protein
LLKQIMDDEQLFNQVHGGHEAVDGFAHQHPDNASSEISSVGHGQRVVTNLGDAAGRMIRGKDVQPAVGCKAATAPAALRGTQRPLRIVHTALVDFFDHGRGQERGRRESAHFEIS